MPMTSHAHDTTPGLPDILCIGSVLWDVIGRSARTMHQGADMPGRITRLPGGVALNIAMTLARDGLRPALLSAVGQDAEGDALIAACAMRGIETRFLHRLRDLPTDQYMAIEGANGLIAAIADAHSLEAAGDAILAPLRDGQLPSPYPAAVALDGNLTPALLSQIATGADFAAADLRVAPASPGKATRLVPFVQAGRGTLYVNCEEAGLICAALNGADSAPEPFTDAAKAARALLDHGAARVLVTNGAEAATEGSAQDGLRTAKPRQITARQITGAGDTFMAAHIAAELRGAEADAALAHALEAAATYVSGETSNA